MNRELSNMIPSPSAHCISVSQWETQFLLYCPHEKIKFIYEVSFGQVGICLLQTCLHIPNVILEADDMEIGSHQVVVSCVLHYCQHLPQPAREFVIVGLSHKHIQNPTILVLDLLWI